MARQKNHDLLMIFVALLIAAFVILTHRA
jgi:predicted nucleic acid-binding Zn ribbon protein